MRRSVSALDLRQQNILRLLAQEISLKLGLTIVLITHEMHVSFRQIYTYHHRVAVMEEGRKPVESGEVIEEIFKNPQPNNQPTL